MKVIRLTESDLVKIVKRVISEQVVQGDVNDPWEYKKEGNNYYTRKKGSQNWKLTSGKVKDAISSKIFAPTSPKQPQNQRQNNKSLVNPNQIITQPTDTFTPYSKDTLSQKGKYIFKSFEEAIKLIGQISKRAFEQLNDLKVNKKFDGQSFIIVNKDSAIASLFDGNYKFILKSSITTGKTKDKGEKGITHEDWANLTLDWGKNSDNRVKSWIQNNKDLIKPDGKIDYEKYRKKGKNDFPFSYQILKDKKQDVTRSGIYQIGSGFKSHYAGAPDITNTYPMVDIETGKKYVQALHVYSDTSRGQTLTKASSQDVESSKDYTRMGSGCVNVDKNFILGIQKYNPKFVVILPDSGGKVDIGIVPMKTWSQKIVDIGDRCVKSFSSLF